MEVGERIRQLRQQRGMSINRLAAAAGVAHSVVSRLEHGHVTNPTAETLRRLATALEVPLTELLGIAGMLQELDFLPAYLKSFVAEPDNAPFLELAYTLRQAGFTVVKKERI